MKKIGRAWGLGLAFCLLAGGWGWTAEYYVAQKDPAADDQNPGTTEKPLKTLKAALPKMRAGDTLFVRAGVYREGMRLKGEAFSGTSVRPTLVQAWPGDEVIIKGSDVATGWKKHDGAIWVKEDWPPYPWVFCDGKPLEETGAIDHNVFCWSTRKDKDKGLKDMKAGSFWYDAAAKKAYAWLEDGSDPNEHVMELTVPDRGIEADGNHLHIAGFKLIHAGIGLGGAYNIVVDCDVSWTTFLGIYVSGRNNTLLRCRSNHNGNSGGTVFGSGQRVEDCEFSFNNWQRWDSPEKGGTGHAGGMKNGCCDSIIRGCVFEGNIVSIGVWFDFDVTQVTIENCRCFHNDGCGIHYEIGERAIIQNNICYENKDRGIYLCNAAYCLLAHNVCYRNGSSGIVVACPDRAGGMIGDD